jgi:hypothetical protein
MAPRIEPHSRWRERAPARDGCTFIFHNAGKMVTRCVVLSGLIAQARFIEAQ